MSRRSHPAFVWSYRSLLITQPEVMTSRRLRISEPDFTTHCLTPGSTFLQPRDASHAASCLSATTASSTSGQLIVGSPTAITSPGSKGSGSFPAVAGAASEIAIAVAVYS